MILPGKTTKRAGSTLQVVIGFLLGALLTFSVQIYADLVQDRRAAEQARTQHIERVMIATNGVTFSAGQLFFRTLDIAVKARAGGQNADIANFMPDTAAIGELRAVSMLYLPEVTPQVERVTKAYRGFMDDLTKTTMPALMKYKPGDPLPTMLSQPVIDELMQSTQALEAKLVEIAKRDRRS